MNRRHTLNYVAQMFEVDPTRIVQPNRGRQSVAQARDVYFYILHKEGKSHHEIAEIGERARTSVTHSIIRTKKALEKDDYLNERVQRLLHIVRNTKIKEPSQL